MRLRDQRLSKKSMFKYVAARGRLLRGEFLSLHVAVPEQNSRGSRVGFLIRKKTGKAAFRNLLRRKFRGLFNKHRPYFRKPSWVLFDVPSGTLKTSMKELKKSAEKMLKLI